MNNEEQFSSYRLLILEALKDLKADQAELYDFLRDHMEKEDGHLTEIRDRLAKLESDRMHQTQMWSFGIASLTSLLVGIISRYVTRP